ncbi:hypothetical protein GGR56DRAFT_685900 [Xylariaceae sp. FL0804]|nr:hypothetical protein GGR56DRAFT_685900 [Xylariaceae sp. FL0804]
MQAVWRWFAPSSAQKDNKAAAAAAAAASSSTRGLRPLKLADISAPVSGSFQKLTDRTIAQGDSTGARQLPPPPPPPPQQRQRYVAHAVTSDFTPREQGREATLAYVHASSAAGGGGEQQQQQPSHSHHQSQAALLSLLEAQDRAERHLASGPRTRGTREALAACREPGRRALAQVHRARRQAEVAVRYGAPGLGVYNFSRSCRWNWDRMIAGGVGGVGVAGEKAPRLPDLQLGSPLSLSSPPVIPPRVSSLPKNNKPASAPAPLQHRPAAPPPYTPIDWVQLPPPAHAADDEHEYDDAEDDGASDDEHEYDDAEDDAASDDDEEYDDAEDDAASDEGDYDPYEDGDYGYGSSSSSSVGPSRAAAEDEWGMREATAAIAAELAVRQLRARERKPRGPRPRVKGPRRRLRRQRPVDPMPVIVEVNSSWGW